MISFFGHGGSLFCQFDFVMLYSIVSWTMYIVHTYERFSIFCSPWQVCISQIFFRCWLLSLSFSSFVFFVTFQLLCSNQKICLQFCPIKSPHHEMPRKSLRVMHYCKFLHMRWIFEWFCKRISKVIISFALALMQLCIFAPKYYGMITIPLSQFLKITKKMSHSEINCKNETFVVIFKHCDDSFS